MSDLQREEKIRLEMALGMQEGYVLGFTNDSFAEFFSECGVNIYDIATYPADGWSCSKANRMRAFWKYADNHTVGKVLTRLFDNWDVYRQNRNGPRFPPPCQKCIATAERLLESKQSADIVHLDTEDEIVATLTDLINQAVKDDRPETSLDRLHTLFVQYFRLLCERWGVSFQQDEPLHSVFGKYVKHLDANGQIESKMTRCVLKASISHLDAYNDIRNNKSLAHPNPPLNRRESEFVLRSADNLLRFISALEADSRDQENDKRD